MIYMSLEIGQAAPEFALPDQDGVRRALSDYRGQWVILYFYPKDDTPGCTTEACQMRDNLRDFNQAKTEVLGISVDSVASHKKFADKYHLTFRLLSDQSKQVVTQYGVWVEKTFMGRTYMGTERTTLLIDPEGQIVAVYAKVKPEGHASQVLQDVRQRAGI
jgi:peroxiredoxin Q/BCP